MKASHSDPLKTPAFILDKEEFIRSIKGFRNALQKRFKSHLVGLSVKTNSLPFLLHLAYEEGCAIEVVSEDEYQLALSCGIPISSIIYNGPLKSKETFLEAISHGAIVNIETLREIEWLKALPSEKHFGVGIRINVNISQISPQNTEEYNDTSRFGFSAENDALKNALMEIQSIPNVSLQGLHLHRTTKTRAVDFYRDLTRYAIEIIERYHLEIKYLDLGGGYFGIFPDKPTYEDYSEAIYEVLKERGHERLSLIVEPGNALVASAFSFISEIIDVKKINNTLTFLTTDGSRMDVDPFFKKSSYMYEVLTADELHLREKAPYQVVTGCTCLEYDRLFSLENFPLLRVGDRILYRNTGAYTLTLSPLFIRYWPRVYLLENGLYTIVRDAWSEKEVISKSNL